MEPEHQYCSIICSHCGHQITVPVYCKNRFCAVCSVHRNRVIRFKLEEFIKSRKLAKYHSYKFLTLTVRNEPTLPLMVDHLIKSFRRLRQRAFWRNNVIGGAMVIEIAGEPDNWHAHLHIVLESGFLPFKALLAEWNTCSGSTGVFIRKIHSSQVIGYITKYITKSAIPVQEQLFMSESLHGRRLFQPFGGWFKPIAAIKPMIYWCPDCDHSDWFYGTGSDLHRKSSINWRDVIHKKPDKPTELKQLTFVNVLNSKQNCFNSFENNP